MRISTFFAAILLFFFGGTAAALAHDVLVDQDPSDGAVLTSAPERITLSFNNSLNDFGEGATVINVLDSSGNVVIDDTPTVSGMDAIQEVSGLDDGAYYIVWRVVSSDGHPISGSSTFAVGEDGEALLAELPSLDLSDDETVEDDVEGVETETISGSEESGLSTATVTTLVVVGVGVLAAVIVLITRKRK